MPAQGDVTFPHPPAGGWATPAVENHGPKPPSPAQPESRPPQRPAQPRQGPAGVAQGTQTPSSAGSWAPPAARSRRPSRIRVAVSARVAAAGRRLEIPGRNLRKSRRNSASRACLSDHSQAPEGKAGPVGFDGFVAFQVGAPGLSRMTQIRPPPARLRVRLGA